MAGELTHLRIAGLHRRRTLDIPIRDNRLVLVGENGMGKSTVVNLLYFFLTCQWHRMRKYTFDTISATINSREISVSQAELAPRPIDGNPRIYRSILEKLINRSSFPSPEYITRIESLLRKGEIARLQKAIAELAEHEFSHEVMELVADTVSDELVEKGQILKSAITDQVLYLPTYRRIEQELSSILPNIRPNISQGQSVRKRRKRSEHLELVEFGMQDVEEIIQRKMEALKEKLRAGLSELTGTYLRDVILGEYHTADPSAFRQLNDAAVDDIFSRIDKSILPEREQEHLKVVLNRIRAGASEKDKSEQDVVTHFLTRLIKLHESQQEAERDAEEFVRVCNSYLIGKGFVYDKSSFHVSLQPYNEGLYGQEPVSDDGEQAGAGANTDALTLHMLSSGEKQIVSLFSHIYLSDGASYFVIIDEPELSLSVPWQRRFLPDILKTKRCNGLVAVTHSPFVFDNELDSYAHSLEEFTGAPSVVA